MRGNVGYRQQLDRARRFLDLVSQAGNADWTEMDDVEFQDMMWAFFQNCWHVKDWIKNDPVLPQSAKDQAIALSHQSPELMMCRQLCNGTKHLERRPGASHHHVNTTIVPGQGINDMDCLIDDGHGNLISGKQLGHECIAEWERILQSQELATERLS